MILDIILCRGDVRGSGKSFSVATYLVLKTFEKGNVILFSRWTMVSADISIIPEFTSKIEEMGVEHFFNITRNEITNKLTGSKIYFKGIKTGSKLQTASLKSIEGLNIFVLDEAEELHNESIFDTINLSVRELGVDNEVILLFNPTTKKHWLYKRWFLNEGVQPGSNISTEDVTYIHTSYLDNIDNLDESFIKELEKLKEKDLDKYNNIVLGHFLDSKEGVIFKNWQIGTFPEEFIEDSEFFLDFGFSKDPSALGRAYMDHSTKTIYVRGELYKNKLVPSVLAEKVFNIAPRGLIIADSASPGLIEQIRLKGCNIRPIKKPKVLERIEIMKGWNIIVDPSSKNLIDELNNYSWDTNYELGERPIDDFNHYLDGLGYLIWHRTFNTKRKKYSIY